MDGGVALQEERDGALVNGPRRALLGGSADEVVLEAQKGFGGTRKCHGGRLHARCHGDRP